MFKRIKHAWMVLTGKAVIRQVFDKDKRTFDHPIWSAKDSVRDTYATMPIQFHLKGNYIPLVPMHARFLANLLTNEETKFNFSRCGQYRMCGHRVHFKEVNRGVYRFKFYTPSGPVYCDCFSETFAGALQKLAKLINSMEEMPVVFKEDIQDARRTNTGV